jgi:hypothetical protein
MNGRRLDCGRLLAIIDIPDFTGWLGRITAAVEKIAGLRRENAAAAAVKSDGLDMSAA